jgi:heme/copper-type cytochrome/quinol oxidase subunit 4
LYEEAEIILSERGVGAGEEEKSSKNKLIGFRLSILLTYAFWKMVKAFEHIHVHFSESFHF